MKPGHEAPSESAGSKHAPSMSATTRGGSTAIPNSPARGGPRELLGDLVASPNNIAAGVGEILQAFGAAATGVTEPIMIDFENRTMALGRRRMAAMNGRNAFLYLKSKFGLLNATSGLYLEAAFLSDQEVYVEVDMDAWEELVPFMYKLRLISWST